MSETPEWLTRLLAALGILYDDVLGIVNEAKARFPIAVDAIAYVEAWLEAHVGDRVRNPGALAALIFSQLTAGGGDPDSGTDV